MKHASVTCASAVVALVVLGVSASPASEPTHAASPTAHGDVLPMLRFYAGDPTTMRVGNFPGTLICLRCDLKPGPGAMAQCEKEGHRHALSMESDSMVHPLLASNEEVLERINSGELHGKEVVVHGRYLSSTGAIFVDRIDPADEGGGGGP